MEEKDFSWLCKLLLSVHARVNIPETLFFHNDILDLWLSPDSSTGLHRRTGTDEPVKSLQEACKYFAGKTIAAGGNLPVCYVVSKSARVEVESSQIDSILERREVWLRANIVQQYCEPKGGWHYYHVRFKPGDGYVCSFHRVGPGGVREQESNPRLLYKVTDTVRVIMRVVEETKQKRVMELGLDIVLDVQNVVWVMGSSICQIAPPGLPVVRSQPLPTKEKPSKPPLFPTPHSQKAPSHPKLPFQFTYKRGQLRNVDSNLNSPLRILSPSASQDSGNDCLTPVKESFGPVNDQKTGTLGAKTRSLAFKTHRSERLFHPNFQEMLLLNYGKKTGIYDLNLFVQDMMWEDDSEVVESPCRIPRRPTQPSFPFEPVLSDSSIEEKAVSSLESDESLPAVPRLPPVPKPIIKSMPLTKRQLYTKSTRNDHFPGFKPILSDRKRPFIC